MHRVARKRDTVHWPNPSLPKGKGAGPARNTFMAQHAQALIALWDGSSPGTKNMIETATRRVLRIHAPVIYEQRLTPEEHKRLFQGKWKPSKP